ncbi:hypothetical protein DBV15_01138, partial [Temnothorax longispinosus]
FSLFLFFPSLAVSPPVATLGHPWRPSNAEPAGREAVVVENEKPRAANTRSAKDRHGLVRGKEEAGVNAIYTMTTIASLLAQSAYVQPRKGARWREGAREREREKEREGGRESCYDTRLTGDSAPREDGAGDSGEDGRARGMKVGMFVVRVIWPIKPRGGARRASGVAPPFAE